MNIVSKNATIKGFYRIRKYKASTGELVQDTGEFPNLITDQGLSHWLTSYFCNTCFVGTGTATPTYTDTTMSNFLASTTNLTNTVFTNAVYPGTDYCSQSLTYRFDVGVAAGNLTEVGVGYVASGNKVSSRALIVDGSGNPITLTILSDEYLDVTYTLRTYLPMNSADASYNVVISGTTYAVTSRASDITTWRTDLRYSLQSVTNFNVLVYGTGSTMGAVTGIPSGTQATLATAGGTSVSISGGVVTISKAITGALGSGNVSGGIVCMYMACDGTGTGLGSYTQYAFSPAIPKTSTKILTLNFSQTLTRL